MPNLTEILDRIQAEADAAKWHRGGCICADCKNRRTNVPRLVAATRVLVEAVERMSLESMDETMGLVADETLGEAQAILEGRDDVS